MKKRILIIVLVVLFVLASIPVPVAMTDGGSSGLYAILWQYTKVHEMTDADGSYRVGNRVTLLGFIPIYDDTHTGR